MADPVLKTQEVEWADVQGLVIRGYGDLDEGCYTLLRIDDPAAAKTFIARVAKVVTSAMVKPSDSAVHIAFSAPGLAKLGVSPDKLKTFSTPFQEGMVTPHRSRLLGDAGANDPSNWRWGSTAETTPDIILVVLAKTLDDVSRRCEEVLGDANGCAILHQIEARNRPDTKNHFGIADGISQPLIRGAVTSKGEVKGGDVEPGEFVLGYQDSFGQNTNPPEAGTGKLSAFGKNGTYLILRQMDMDVPAFQQFIHSQEMSPDLLAAKMVGRWPDGSPIVLYPNAPKPGSEDEPFSFGGDSLGMKCPIGSHIRRANPRDELDEPGETGNAAMSTSVQTVAHHRLLRRGRIYGDYNDPFSPERCPPAVRGLHFLCLVASIGNQFEFVQQSWLNSTKFNDLYDEVDPLVGVSTRYGGIGPFSMPGIPVRQRLASLPQFVTVRGGAYFFVPGLRGLGMIAELGSLA